MTDPITQSMMQGAAGAAGGGAFVDDVFSIDRWKGNSSIRTIDNGLDLLGEGGIVFIKGTDIGSDWCVGGTGIGDDHCLCTNNGSARDNQATKFRQLNTNGFTVGDDNEVNNSSYDYIGFSFRKQKQFMDIVEYTGNGSAQTIAHKLGSVPGMMIVKDISSSGGRDWNVYHRHSFVSAPGEYRLRLDSDSSRSSGSGYWNNTAPTATHFTVGTSNSENGAQYIAIIFAHDEAVHGEESDQSIISCGSYAGTGSNVDINIGWEPSFFLVKNASQNGDNWILCNSLFTWGQNKPSNDQPHDANTSSPNRNDSQSTSSARISQIPNGVRILNESQHIINEQHETYIYLAVRSAVGLVAKLPAAGTDVFNCGPANGPSDCPPGSWESDFAVDFAMEKKPGQTTDWEAMTRKSGIYRWFPNITSGLPSQNNSFVWDSSTGFTQNMPGSSSFWGWSRSRGFDVQCTYAAGAGTYNHNLGQVPEMIWVGSLQRNDWHGVGHHKLRTSNPWNYIAYMNNDSNGNSGSGYWNNTAPTTTQFTLGNNEAQSYYNIMVMLWCSVPGICKIDDYNGDGGTSNAVACGFQPRYVMIKRVDQGGDGWKIWDSVRGANSLRFDSSSAQASDNLVTFTSTGFTLISPDGTVNASGGRYIYHAQA